MRTLLSLETGLMLLHLSHYWRMCVRPKPQCALSAAPTNQWKTAQATERSMFNKSLTFYWCVFKPHPSLKIKPENKYCITAMWLSAKVMAKVVWHAVNILLYSNTFRSAAFLPGSFYRSCVRGELLSVGLATVLTPVSLFSLPVESVTVNCLSLSASIALFPVSFLKSPTSFFIMTVVILLSD